jgi:glutamyl-tRNA reductase
MQLYAFGINHQTAPLAVREQVAFTPERLGEALCELTQRGQAREAAILSTCNRTEIYCNTEHPVQTLDWLADFHHLNVASIKPYAYTLPRDEAARHAFRVASGLDSMVLGETQILGQMKQAVSYAEQAGTLGTLLHKLFQRTFSVAKSVRSHTEIGAASVSMAAAAVRLAERIFPSITQQSVLFIGAGEMIDLCAAHFGARQPRRMLVVNRTVERARALADRYQAQAAALTELPEHLPGYDIIVSCTASPLPILGKGMIERSLKSRRHKPQFIVDLAVPRDVESEVAELEDVFLYTVDDLGKQVQQGRDARAAQVAEAETIIETGVAEFVHWMDSRERVPTIRSLRDQAERHRRHELERALRAIERGEPPAQVLEQLSHGLTNKLLHAPTRALGAVRNTERDQLVDLLTRLYDLPRE